jgi:CheY-like chemotaxis protein
MPLRVLVVDDEAAIADSVCEIMRQAGYDVASSYTARGALNRAVEFQPDVLLSDVLLPDLNGFELALTIQAAHPNCRLILFSGQAATLQLSSRYTQIFKDKGIEFTLLPKPIHPKTLLKEIQETTERR